MDGIEAVHIIRNEIGTEYAKTVPIIALTANAIAGNDVMFLKNGFQAFLTKPIDIRKLNEAINRWVRDKKYEKTLIQKENIPPAETRETFLEQNKTDAMDSAAAITEYLHNNVVKGIYFEKAMERFGTGDIWLDSVKTYISCTPLLLNDLHEVNQENLEHYRITVHGIKGSSYAIAADDVGRLAEDLEKAARNEDMDFIHSNGEALITAVEALIDNLKLLEEKIEANFSKPKKAEPSKEVLDKILIAASSYNITEIDTAMEELEKYQYESQGDIVPWLKEQIELSEFEQIKERLSSPLV
jgi:HPt (histidine-containing phosphotransfer) domain-containing protein